MGWAKDKGDLDADTVLSPGVHWVLDANIQMDREEEGSGFAYLDAEQLGIALKLKTGDPLSAEEERVIRALNFEWMSKLGSYGQWNVLKSRPKDHNAQPYGIAATNPVPSFPLLHWVRLRILRANLDNDMDDARNELLNLIYLALRSGELLLSSMAHVALIVDDVRSHLNLEDVISKNQAKLSFTVAWTLPHLIENSVDEAELNEVVGMLQTHDNLWKMFCGIFQHGLGTYQYHDMLRTGELPQPMRPKSLKHCSSYFSVELKQTKIPVIKDSGVPMSLLLLGLYYVGHEKAVADISQFTYALPVPIERWEEFYNLASGAWNDI